MINRQSSRSLRIGGTGALLGGVVLAIAMPAAASPAARHSTPAVVHHAPSAATVRAVHLAGSALQKLGQATYPHTFAGTWVDEHTGRAYLNVTSATSGHTAALQRAADGAPLVTATVPRSWDELMTLQSTIAADIAGWRAQGVQITGVWADAPSDTIKIGVATVTSATTTALQDRYGVGNVEVVQQDATDATSSRTNDSSPYNGADEITSKAGETCSVAFGAHKGVGKSTGAYLLTVGHCFPDGTAVYNNGTKIGTISIDTSVYKDQGSDVAYVSGTSSSDLIWETNTTRGTSDGSEELPAQGSTICMSGAASNEQCGTVQSTSGCYPYTSPNKTFCHLGTVSANHLLVAGGDSGGAWFDPYTSSGTKYFGAIGIQSGGVKSTEYTCNTQVANNDSCYTEARYTNISVPYNQWNLWVNYPS